MPRGLKGSDAQHLPRGFRVRWDAARQRWGIFQGERWRFTASLAVQVPTWNDPAASDGTLHGNGVVRTLKRGDIVITA